MALADRIRMAREARGLHQEDVANALGVKQQTVQGWEAGSHGIKAPNLRKLAAFLETTVEDLYGSRIQNVEPARSLGRMIPVISWVAAGQWAEAVDMHQPGEAEKWLPAPCPLSDRAFALRVTGDSMQAPYGESYPPGCFIYVEPEMRTPETGTPIIARLVETGEVTFKVYVRDGNRQYLKALNPTYLPMTEEFEVIGTIVGHTFLR